MLEIHEWHQDPPKEDGDFFYTGQVPDGGEIVAIVQIYTHPDSGTRMACLLIPPGWRGDKARRQPTIHAAPLDKWHGQWSGPEHGLCCAVVEA